MHTQFYIAAMAQFIETNQGGKNLHFEGYVYTKIRDGANRRRVKEEKRMQTLFDRFNAGNISLEEYLGAIKHQTGFNKVLKF